MELLGCKESSANSRWAKLFYLYLHHEWLSISDILTIFIDSLILPIRYVISVLFQEARWLCFETGGEFDFLNPDSTELFLACKNAQAPVQVILGYRFV